jgi:D-alanine transaminase
MPRIAYVNHRYVPLRGAYVSVEDRGFLFADGVYEVTSVLDGQLIDNEAHLDRLGRSMAELEIPWPLSRRALSSVQVELVRRNRLREGGLYLQVTRGAAPRDFKYPAAAQPSIVMFTQARALANPTFLAKGVSIVSVPDIRWARRDIKSVALLPQCMAKQAAARADAFEAVMIDTDGTVTEGGSANIWMVTVDGTLVTRSTANHRILAGITRRAVSAAAASLQLPIEERTFTLAELKSAREVFLTSATTVVAPVVRIDDAVVGAGMPGDLTYRLRDTYFAMARSEGGLEAVGPWHLPAGGPLEQIHSKRTRFE